MQKQVTAALQKEMSRKEFFKTLGLGLMAMVGISALLQVFGKDMNPLANQQNDSGNSNGYGSSAYGR